MKTLLAHYNNLDLASLYSGPMVPVCSPSNVDVLNWPRHLGLLRFSSSFYTCRCSPALGLAYGVPWHRQHGCISA
ncbi:hypothetical protein PILCRDRAFT_205769 [Piloderma croceum F 1598]|uniref:Uncharacterized protein n=1 Tax=Piloderma croceum (strain F 1598) TaxID=765440 RepID=A0A0C3GHC8_PILCF|nr:hypothetical protein PILCRDRAFT_205769 [Piloderma croceum F 1598]